MFNDKELEELFITMINAQDKSRYEGRISCYRCNPRLIVGGKKIDDIHWDGDNFNLVWYNEYEEQEPLEYYRKEVVIQPNRNLVIYLLGGRS